MHIYRTHTCGELTDNEVGLPVRLSGWIHRRRDHGGVLFVDLRDHYGITQIVADSDSDALELLENTRVESVVTVEGVVKLRREGTENNSLNTGKIELFANKVTVLSEAEELPMPVAGEQDYPEDIRLRYRFLDLRRETLHNNIMMRTKVISEMRKSMEHIGFVEYATPILTASSPEGARDFLVPSRLHPNKFYALPQAPQQYKQLLMVAGFDRYFQIAPCFRDEDPRADRLPGEFYQLDLEMSFVTQEEVWETMEPVIHGIFEKFGDGYDITPNGQFPRIPYADAMEKYGSDKPDLRNPLIISDVSNHFTESGFGMFQYIVSNGGVVRAIPAPNTADKSRKFFDAMNEWAKSEGFAGLGYVTRKNGEFGGPIAKNHGEDGMVDIYNQLGLGPDDGLFFAAGFVADAIKLSGAARTKIAEQLDLIEQNSFRFCWIIDFPFYEENDGKLDFAHNPFSMPQSDLDDEPASIKAYQYDLVCNGYELASGSIRNQNPDLMVKAFGKVGINKEQVEERFGALYNAFQYGAPPHGGMAAGVDRIIMLLCHAKNLREVSLFPMNQRAEDLMMNSPSEVSSVQKKELGLK